MARSIPNLYQRLWLFLLSLLVSPRSETEKSLANIFSQVLSQETIGIYNDFFELGGHSLLATQLVAQLLNVFDVEIT